MKKILSLSNKIIFYSVTILTIVNLNFANLRSKNFDLKTFEKQLEEYKPNAPWIMGELINLSLKDFFTGFKTSILMLAKHETRGEYFNEKNILEPETLYSKSLWQCVVYEIFLKYTYIRTTDRDINIVVVSKKNSQKLNLIHIFDAASQLDIEHGEHHPMFIFYAFYCDCLINQFSLAIKTAYSYIDDPEMFKAYSKMSSRLNKQIKLKIAKLKEWSNSTYDKTKFEAVYEDLHEKNDQILSLLKQQIKAQDHEEVF